MRRLHVPAIVTAVAMVAALYAWAVFATTPAHPGAIGMNLNALGTDWMVFYSGAQHYFAGKLDQLFDGEAFTAGLNTAFAGWLSEPTPFRPWVYPPSYLLVLLPFGALPFLASYLAFQLAGAALLAAALWRTDERPPAAAFVVAAALLSPAAAINAGMGQNALLMAGLLVAGFRLVATRPLLGGAVLGLLTMKPQFWLLVPVALLAARQWKPLAAAVLSGAAVAALSAVVFGLDSWRDWFALAQASYDDAHGRWVELGRMWGDSVYACVSAAGLPASLADAAQVAAILVAAALVYAAFALRLAPDRRIAIVLAATILAAPHSSLADTVLLAAAVALWCRPALASGTPLAQWTLALALWLAPLFNPPLVSPVGRLTPLLIVAFIAMALAPALPALRPHLRPGLHRFRLAGDK